MLRTVGAGIRVWGGAAGAALRQAIMRGGRKPPVAGPSAIRVPRFYGGWGRSAINGEACGWPGVDGYQLSAKRTGRRRIRRHFA